MIDGGVRDVAALEALGFPVFSRTVALRGAAKVGAWLGRGRPWRWPGSPSRRATGWWATSTAWWSYPGDRLADVAEAGRARAAAEDGYFAALRAGATTVELLGLDASLIEDGGPRAG